LNLTSLTAALKFETSQLAAYDLPLKATWFNKVGMKPHVNSYLIGTLVYA
jgi:hypothetical protein